MDRSLQMYTVGDGGVALWLVAGPDRLEVWRKIVGTRDETVRCNEGWLCESCKVDVDDGVSRRWLSDKPGRA